MSSKFIQKMFPNGRLDGRGGCEVNGLPAGSEPQGVEILDRWNDSFVRKGERREFFHVTDGEHCALLRVCSAMEGCGYDEFAVIHEVAETDTLEANTVAETAHRWASSIGGR